MRTEKEITAAIAAAQASYNAIASTGTAAEIRAKTETLTALRTELAEVLADGAVPRADAPAPLGMLKRPAYIDRGNPYPPIYEVSDGEVRARGWSPALAVENWNNGVFVEEK